MLTPVLLALFSSFSADLTDRSDLQRAFDEICLLLSTGLKNNNKRQQGDDGTKKNDDQQQQSTTPAAKSYVTLKGAMKRRNDIGLCVSLVKDDNGSTKGFCVTLIQNPPQGDTRLAVGGSFGVIKPIHVSFDAVVTHRSMSPSPPSFPPPPFPIAAPKVLQPPIPSAATSKAAAAAGPASMTG